MAEIIERIELCDDGIRMALKLTVPCSQAGVRTSSLVGVTRFVPLAMTAILLLLAPKLAIRLARGGWGAHLLDLRSIGLIAREDFR